MIKNLKKALGFKIYMIAKAHMKKIKDKYKD